jgi:hypothetical protein
MRRYYIAYGILLIFPIIDFAIAAPVPVQLVPSGPVLRTGIGPGTGPDPNRW